MRVAGRYERAEPLPGGVWQRARRRRVSECGRRRRRGCRGARPASPDVQHGGGRSTASRSSATPRIATASASVTTSTVTALRRIGIAALLAPTPWPRSGTSEARGSFPPVRFATSGQSLRRARRRR